MIGQSIGIVPYLHHNTLSIQYRPYPNPNQANRYRVGYDSKYMVGPMSWSSEATQDAILTLSDPQHPRVKPAAAPPNGKALATSRYYTGRKQFWLGVLVAMYLVYRRYGK